MPEHAPWVVVCGTVHLHGGMDKANAHLVSRLSDLGRTVHVVAHEVADEVASRPGVVVHEVPRPWGSFALGARGLDLAGRRLAARLLRDEPRTRVLVNGASCRWPAVNWVHCVHAAWEPCDPGAPLAFRLRNRLTKWRGRALERAALGAAKLVVANSERTRWEAVRRLGVPVGRTRVVELGSDHGSRQATSEERAESRRVLDLPAGEPVVLFVGALGWDANKGFDTLFAAWNELARDPSWRATLVVAGEGAARSTWERRADRTTWRDHVRFVGHSRDVPGLLAAADLLVAPSRYEAYGLTVREALVRGLPVLVSRNAGVAEHLIDHTEMLLDDPNDVHELARRLREAVCAKPRARRDLADRLRRWTWREMADAMVALVERSARYHRQPQRRAS